MVLLLVQLVISQQIPWTVSTFPSHFVSVNACYFGFRLVSLGAFGVYVRDIGQITGVCTTVLLFVSGVFYPISALPAAISRLVATQPARFHH